MGLHHTYVGSVERDERYLGLTNLARIAEASERTASAVLAQAEERASRGAGGASRQYERQPGKIPAAFGGRPVLAVFVGLT